MNSGLIKVNNTVCKKKYNIIILYSMYVYLLKLFNELIKMLVRTELIRLN